MAKPLPTEAAPPLAASSQRAPVTPAAPDMASAPADTPPAATADEPGDGALWAAVGAGALLLAGGVALASRRRRSVDERIVDDRDWVIDSDHVAPPAAPAMAAAAARPAMPLAEAEPRPVVAPVAAQRTTAPVEPRSRAAMVEAMASEPPSAANPFLTQRRRRRRADFLLRTGAVAAPTTGGTAETAAAHSDPVQPDRYGSFKIGGRLAPRPGRRIVPG